VLIETHSAEGYACAEAGGFLTALDTALTDELVNEGLAREIVRSIQDARKQAGLDVSDRIVLGVSGSVGVGTAVGKHRDYIMSETLATGWETGQDEALYTDTRDVGEEHWTLEFRKA
jgi:isoleucyl-tRNA synthetase